MINEYLLISAKKLISFLREETKNKGVCICEICICEQIMRAQKMKIVASSAII